MRGQKKDQTPSNGIEIALTRSRAYRWFSQAFLKPATIEESPDALRKILEALGVDGNVIFSNVTKKQCISEFPKLFSHNLTPDSPPYETQYGVSHIFLQSQQLADIAGFYKAFGLRLDEKAHERVDHLAVELEFLAFLSLKEAHALEGQKAAQVDICRDAQRKFLKDHLGRWLPAFGDCIKRKLPEGAYTKVTQALVLFVAWECRRLGVAPSPLRFHESSQDQAPIESGFSCGGPGGPGCGS